MNNLVRANYTESQIASTKYLTKLKKVAKKGAYNIYIMEQGGKYVVVFNNQADLVREVDSNPEALFLVEFLKKGNNKFSYPGEIDGIGIDMTTVAGAQVVISDVVEITNKSVIRIMLD